MSDDATITSSDVARIARLARLELTEAEMASIGQDLNGILGYVKSLQGVALDNVEPTETGSAVDTPLREDEHRPSLARDVALGQSAGQDGTGFIVPKVVG